MLLSADKDDRQLPDFRWQQLRSLSFLPLAQELIRRYVPSVVGIITTVTHIRSAHYAVLRVDTLTNSWVVRIGVLDAADDRPVDNSGYRNTSLFIPTGQRREYTISRDLEALGAAVCSPVWYERVNEGYDLQWFPFLVATTQLISAQQWYDALRSFWSYRPAEQLPVFTNRVKTMTRLSVLPSATADGLRQRYDTQLAVLFKLASTWSVVHGDAHGDNAINTGKTVLLYDLDTACWAPSVWDITHLLKRVGSANNVGYTTQELCSLFPFTDDEIAAALALRQTASEVAAHYRTYKISLS